MVTALLAIASFTVQTKVSKDADTTQRDIERAQEEHARKQDKAEKQLERVEMQLAELVNPVQQLTNHFNRAFESIVLECSFDVHIATYSYECHSPTTQPHVNMYNVGNPKAVKGVAANPFWGTVWPEDEARLQENPASRARWVELVTHTILPSLRELVPIIRSKVCTRDGKMF
jgi:hypothetical protein